MIIKYAVKKTTEPLSSLQLGYSLTHKRAMATKTTPPEDISIAMLAESVCLLCNKELNLKHLESNIHEIINIKFYSRLNREINRVNRLIWE